MKLLVIEKILKDIKGQDELGLMFFQCAQWRCP
jgi:hypothetical protein